MDYHADQVPIVQQANRVWCVYPISGCYTSLQRHLFWVVCAFVLFGHAHEWLTRAAIGFAASYSAAAAAHQVLLAFQAGPQHDADIFATDQVTQTSMLMLVAVALFCPGLVRRTPLVMVMGWVGLVFAAHLAGALVSARLWDGVSRSLVLSACRGDGPCDDPCGRMQASTFFRGYGGDAMVPLRWDTVNVTYAAPSLPPAPSLDDTVVVMPEKGPGWEVVRFMVKQALKVALPMAVAKVNAVHSPQEVRDKVFLRSLSRRQLRPHLLRAGWKAWTLWTFVWARQACWLLCTLVPAFAMIDLPFRVVCFFLFHAFGFRIPEVDDVTYLEPCITWPRYQAGRYAGTAWYALAKIGYLTWFPVLLPQIIQAETFLRTLPESESVRAVGQWSPWLAVTLALVAAILERMTEARSRPPPPPDGGGGDGQARTDWLDAAYVRRACEDAASRAGRELAEAKGWWRRPEDALEAWMRASLAHDVSEEMLPRTMLSALGQVGELKRGRAAILPLTRVRGRRSWAVVVRGLHSAVRRAESWGRTTDAGGGESGSGSGSSGKSAKQD